MSLASNVCESVEIDITSLLNLNITLPGGVSLQSILESGQLPYLGTAVSSIIQSLSSAILPLVPFFKLLDVVLKIIDCIMAIPKALGPPPNPTKIITAIAKLAKAVAALAPLFPPLSVPYMVVTTIKTIVVALTAFIQELEHQIVALTTIDAGRLIANALAGDPDTAAGAALLAAALDCAESDLDQMRALGLAGLGPLSNILQILNVFVSLIGIPQILPIDVSGGTAQDLLAPLNAAVATLQAISNAIPT